MFEIVIAPGWRNSSYRRDLCKFSEAERAYVMKVCKSRRNLDRLLASAFIVTDEALDNIAVHSFGNKGGTVWVWHYFATRGPRLWLEFTWNGKIEVEDLHRMKAALTGKLHEFDKFHGNGLLEIKYRVSHFSLPRNDPSVQPFGTVRWRLGLT